jgi:hypothetical protein
LVEVHLYPANMGVRIVCRNARNLKAVFDGAILQQLFVSSVIICVIGFKLIVVSF